MFGVSVIDIWMPFKELRRDHQAKNQLSLCGFILGAFNFQKLDGIQTEIDRYLQKISFYFCKSFKMFHFLSICIQKLQNVL
jgi:hypothetical protein